jgi:hypothetical protein
VCRDRRAQCTTCRDGEGVLSLGGTWAGWHVGKGARAELARYRERVRGRAGKKDTARKCKGCEAGFGCQVSGEFQGPGIGYQVFRWRSADST